MNTANEDVPMAFVRSETGIGLKELRQLMKTLGIASYKMNGANHFSRLDADRLIKEIDLPKELKPEIRRARFLKYCPNPRFVYAIIEGYPGKRLVGISSRIRKRIENKRFLVEVVKDKDGVSFRHAGFLKSYAING